MIKNELKRYDEYMDSGIEWLGKFPKYWPVCKLKDVVFYQEGPGIMGDDFQDVGVPLIRISGMKGSTVSLAGCNFLDPLKVSNKWEHFKLKLGDLVVSASATTGIVAKVTEETVGAIPYTGLIKFKPRSKLNIDYLNYFLGANVFTNQIDFQKSGTTIQHYGPTHLGRVFAVIPPIREQKSITHYLDTKTTQIDCKIGLLNQKAIKYGNLKQSLINETVTRGLDKTVSMKDSEVEWIEDVPEHWGINKLSQSFSQIGSGTTPKSGIDVYYEGGTINWINTGDLNDSILFSCKRVITEKALKDYSLNVYPAGSIIIAMYGATIGKVSISMIEGCTNQACCVLNKSKIIDTKFLFYWFISKREFIISLSYGGGQPNISQDTVKKLRVISPKLSEQKAIADYLDTKTAHIDRIIEAINTQIEKLKELRKTLINDVITGKIKVYQEGEII